MEQVQVNSFKPNAVYSGVHAIVQDTKKFGTTTVPWKETFTDKSKRECSAYQVLVKYTVQVEGKDIAREMFSKIVCKEGVSDKVEKLKLKPGDCIKFTGEYSARRGHSRWFTSFEVLHPDFIEKVKSLPTSAI